MVPKLGTLRRAGVEKLLLPLSSRGGLAPSGQCSTLAVTVHVSGIASGIVMVQLCVSNCFSYCQHLF